MKKYVLGMLLLVFSLTNLLAQKSQAELYNDIMKRTQWWRDARFGMFIHFGAYAVPARGEWVKSKERMTNEVYQQYIDAFNPSDFDAKKWAKLAKTAGMKYAVLTAKHHDGYCLFDSKLTDYKLSNKMGGRDLIREFVDAFRAEGIKVGFYYSIIDWNHPDYPNVGNHPMVGDSAYSKRKFNWDNYLKYMHGQVEELVKNYGKIDVLWFDYSFDNYSGEKWKAKELVEMTRKYQPDIIIDNRLELNHGVSTKGRTLSPYGDFFSPEQAVPDAPLVDANGNLLPWESCITLNNNWGYNQTDHQWKSPQLVINTLVNCVSKNGNLLLNVGPDAKGNIPNKSIEILSEVGKWMSQNSESIYGCGAATLAKPDWGYYTQKNNQLYAHWMIPIVGGINIKGMAKKLKNAYILRDGTEAHIETKWFGNSEEGNLFINVNKPVYMTYELPDKINTVIKVVLK